MGVIYMSTSPSGKIYIGQHATNEFNIRKKSHYRNYIEFLKKKCILELNKKFYPDQSWSSNPSGFCTSLYCAFKKYGYYSFSWMVLHINIAKNLLNCKEDQAMLRYNTIVPHGYNLKLNGRYSDMHSYSDASRKQMSISQSKVFKTKLHKYRKKHKELEGVPQFVTYFESGGIKGYRILRHPKCPFKEFTSATTHVAELKERMLTFLKKCMKKAYVTTQKRKQSTGVPKGITEQRPGRFLVQFRRKGIKYNKFFSQSPRVIALKLAIEWMNNKKKQLIQGEGSETK